MPSTEMWNQEAEAAVLAAILKSPEDYFSINDVNLTTDDFMGTDNRRVAKAIFETVADQKSPTIPYVLESLKLAGHDDTGDYVSSLTSIPVSIADAHSYARTVRNLAISRNLTQVGAKFIEIGRERRSDSVGAIADAEKAFRKLTNELPEPDRSPKPSDILRRMRNSTANDYIPINFSPTLQEITGGLSAGSMWVVGGFSSVGKSAFGINLALDSLVTRGKRVAIISAEMTQEQYLLRMLSILSGIPQHNLRDNVTIGIGQHDARIKAESQLERSHLLVYDTLAYVPAIQNELIKLKNNDGLDLVIFDFLQSMYIHGEEVKDARESILTIQRLAKELQFAGVVFSQLSNSYAQFDLDPKADKNFYSFKGSGAIRDAADVGIILRRERKRQSPILNVSVEKNRHGEIGNIDMRMELATGKIYEVERDPDYEDDEDV